MKSLVTLALAMLAVFAPAAPAVGQQYPPAPLFINVSDSTPVAGDTIGVETGVLDPQSVATLTFASEPVILGSARVGVDGVASLTVTIPDDAALGAHVLTASGTRPDGSPVSISTAVTVVEPGGAAAEPAGLPRTGRESVPVARIGAALFAVGAGLVVLTRRRRISAAF